MPTGSLGAQRKFAPVIELTNTPTRMIHDFTITTGTTGERGEAMSQDQIIKQIEIIGVLLAPILPVLVGWILPNRGLNRKKRHRITQKYIEIRKDNLTHYDTRWYNHTNDSGNEPATGGERMATEYLTEKEIIEWLKVSRATVNRWRQKGMPYVKINYSVRFERGKVQEWIDKGNVEEVK